MPFALSFRRYVPFTLTAVLVLAGLGMLSGCAGSAPSTRSSGSSAAETSGASSQASSTTTPQQLTFDAGASKTGRPRKGPESEFSAAWFPPSDVNGLQQLTDPKKVAALTAAASANPGFWIERPNNHTQPIVFGEEAVSLLSTSTGFSTALIVPVRPIASGPSAATGGLSGGAGSLKPAGYQVTLAGDVGETSFGLRPGTKTGAWALDPNGELVNYGGAIDAVSHESSFTPVEAYVTTSAFDLGGRPAVYLSWAVFRDAKGKELAVALHSPPPIKATWAIAGQPLRLGGVYESKTVFGPVTITPTK